MSKVTVNFAEKRGKMKPMHAVNNGPVHTIGSDSKNTNLEAFREAGIPYARTHDAAFYAGYGGEHTVDITAVFPNFDADPYDEASYDFACTDHYLRVIEMAGTETFYRLGQKIEHYVKKFGTVPPKDFHKWAVICEHIIRHYNYGWANGFHMNIQYWEIWNEPDLDPDDATNKRTWGGTTEQFFDLYTITAKHLKACFPELKIGGPALAHNDAWAKRFLNEVDAPLDFFSWHRYDHNPRALGGRIDLIRKLLDESGHTETESILNEWNYVKGWKGDDYLYTMRAQRQLKGAAYVAATMCVSQEKALDMLMYYDARPCTWNGMFNYFVICDKLKGYYPFYAFNVLYRLKNEVATVSDDEDLYVCAAENDGEGAVMVTYYSDDDTKEEKTVEIDFSGMANDGAQVEFYLLDEEHDLELVRAETFTAGKFKSIVKLPLWSTVLIKLKK